MKFGEMYMNLRERFHEIMNFNTKVKSIKWEMAYWGKTLDRWYCEGLKKIRYPDISKHGTFITSTSNLYTPAWNSIKKTKLPDGIAVTGGGLYWPTQGFPIDTDVRDQFKLDYSQILLNINLLFYPQFEIQVLEENENYMVYIDLDGVKRKFLKETATIPSSLEYPIRDWKSWQEIKANRLSFDSLSSRFPPDWQRMILEYRNRDYPLAIGGYPYGFFGTLAHLLGYERLFTFYYDEPELIHDIANTFTELWIEIYSQVLLDLEVDMVQIWEDISYGSGSMVSPRVMKEFMFPYYKKFIEFLRARGVNHFIVDTDGDCFDIIPFFIEAGVTALFPFEKGGKTSLRKVRKHFPRLVMMGGIPKGEIGQGKDRVNQLLIEVEEILKTGGYIPFADHSIPPEISFQEFSYYRNQLNQLIEKTGEQ